MPIPPTLEDACVPGPVCQDIEDLLQQRAVLRRQGLERALSERATWELTWPLAMAKRTRLLVRSPKGNLKISTQKRVVAPKIVVGEILFSKSYFLRVPALVELVDLL